MRYVTLGQLLPSLVCSLSWILNTVRWLILKSVYAFP